MIVSGCIFYYFKNQTEELQPEKMDILGSEVYIYMPKVKKNEKIPVVFTFHGRGGSATDVVHGSGWDKVAKKEKFMVVSPQYDGYANSYTITGDLMKIVNYITQNYNVDTSRIYASGFSMGGAASVALARDYPSVFAAIAPMGWMFDMPDKDNVFSKYDMPFLVIQGTNEFTYETASGEAALHKEEQKAVRGLLLFNELIDKDTYADVDKYYFWGFKAHKEYKIYANGRNWFISEFYKEDYKNPIGKLILRENAKHTKDKYSSTLAWDFMKNFARNENGEVVEIK